MPQPVEKKRPNPSGGADYKHKLDEAASRAKSPPQEEGQKTGIVDKVAQYVPAVGTMLGSQNELEREQSPAKKNAPGPPDRPMHDTQIGEFIKDQHHSNEVVDIKEPTQA